MPDTPIDKFLERHSGEMLFAESATVIIEEQVLEGYADAPPPEADYRPADIEAIACWNCSHFVRTGVGDDNWPVGACELWEAKVQGEAVCDKFTADPGQRPETLHQGPAESLDSFEYSTDSSHLFEVFCSDDAVEMASDTGLIQKAILRTGEWKKTPTKKGVLTKPLRIIRDGKSSLKDGIISLQELVDNFNAKAYDRVPIPLTDEEKKDHKNLLRLNQGWIKRLWIKDEDNGISKLMAGMQFTEPDTREKVMRGTYPDVSSGVFFDVQKSDGREFGSALNHVCITHRPFIDGLGPFEVLASDEEKPEEIESFVLSDDGEAAPEWDDRLSVRRQEELISEALHKELGLGDHYVVRDLAEGKAIVFSEIAETSWVVPFSFEGESVEVSPVEDWKLREDEESSVEASQDETEQQSEPAAAPEAEVESLTPLQRAQKRRGLIPRAIKPQGGGVKMAGVADVSQVDFSDPEKAKEIAEQLAEENQRLRGNSKKGEVESKVQKVSDMGFSECPGFLSEYRDILLSDDGEPAMVLFSTDDNGNETGRAALTATEIADRLINALPTDEKGKVLFSGQHLDTGTTEKPPEEEVTLAEGEYDDSPEAVEKRVEAQAKAIGQPMPGSGKE